MSKLCPILFMDTRDDRYLIYLTRPKAVMPKSARFVVKTDTLVAFWHVRGAGVDRSGHLDEGRVTTEVAKSLFLAQ